MRNRRLAGALIALTALGLTACGSGDPLNDSDSGGTAASDTIVVGSANFPESELLAEMYAQVLESKGVKVEKQLNIGAREAYLKALNDGSIDLIPEYNGALLAALVKSIPEDVTTPQAVYDLLVKNLPKGTVALEQSAAEDKDTLTVTKETADKYKLTSIEDLAPVAKDLSIAAGPEFAERFQGLVGLKEKYGLEFKEFKPLDPGGPLTLAALLNGDVQVANIFSTDSAITVNKLVVLSDPKNLFLAQNIVPIVRESKASETVKQALDLVSKALTTENLTQYLAKVQVDKQSPATVAKQFLTDLKIIS